MTVKKKMLLSPDDCVKSEKTSGSASYRDSQPNVERIKVLKTLLVTPKFEGGKS